MKLKSKHTELDPVVTNPDHYKVIFKNSQTRVLDFTDQPGDITTPHDHKDSVLIPFSSFRRRLQGGDAPRDLDISAETVMWLPAQRLAGENTGDTPTHVLFVEGQDPGDIFPWTEMGPD